MTIRKMASAALISAVVLASGAALAGPQQTAENDFNTQVNEAQAALANPPAGLFHSEHVTAEQHLQIAKDFYRQGQPAKAQDYLNFARGELGLSVTPNTATATATAPSFQSTANSNF